MPDRPVYSIGAVSSMLGVPTSTLRTWEERYRLVVPERSPGGHRLYTRDQVDLLQFVAVRVASGMTPGDAHRVLESRLAEGTGTAPEDGEPPPAMVILLAERDPHAAELQEYFLRTEGYQTRVVFGHEEAAAALEQDSIRVAMVDLLMDDGDGIHLCRTLAERGIPVLAVSSLATRDRALEAGATAFLQKPLDPLQFVSTVNDLLGESAFLRRGAR